MNYANIKPVDIANGPGVRVSLFVSGCRRHCKECFNPETWSFSYGKEYTKETEQDIIDKLSHEYIAGLSLLGGEPLEPENVHDVLMLVKRVRCELPEKTVWCYTGSGFEKEVLKRCENEPELKELISLLDVLVDGDFEIARKDLKLRFRGSSNQNIIDVKASLEAKETVLWGE